MEVWSRQVVSIGKANQCRPAGTEVNVTNGSVKVDATTGQLTFTPALNFYGSPTFTYTVTVSVDGNGCDAITSADAVVTVIPDPVVSAPVR